MRREANLGLNRCLFQAKKEKPVPRIQDAKDRLLAEVDGWYGEFISLAWRLGSDQGKTFENEKVEVIYLHGLSVGMVLASLLFDEVGTLYRYHKHFPTIAFNGSEGQSASKDSKPGDAWPGKDWYFREFLNALVPQNKLVPTGPGLHTMDEADKFIALCKERGWKNARVVSVPYHGVRSMLCMVKAMEKANYWLRIHFISAKQTNWQAEMVGAQGTNQNSTMLGELPEEVKKIREKYEGGFAATFGELAVYLDRRDAGVFDN